MIRVRFDPAVMTDAEDIQWWVNWMADSAKATNKVVAAFEDWLEAKPAPVKPPAVAPAGPVLPRPKLDLPFNTDVWSKLKRWILERVYFEKCAYCEVEISGSYGDAEHYRPKGAVEQWNEAAQSRERVFVEIPDPVLGGTLRIEHPGYFWLAHDWRNLVPACSFCNSGTGKGARFDTVKPQVLLARFTAAELAAFPADQQPRECKPCPGYYYPPPSHLDDLEEPLLLNPLNALDPRHPRRHIKFGVLGVESAIRKSPYGSTCITTFQLKRLRAKRQKAQETFKDQYFDKLRRFDPGKPGGSEVQMLLDEYEQGRRPFAAAALDYSEILLKSQPRPKGI